MKHTPGPWRIAEGNEKTFIYALYRPTGWEAETNRFYLNVQNGNRRDVSLEEIEANAQLIARAPELLEENESLKKDLKLVNDCWQTDIKEIGILKSINKELLEALESLLNSAEHCDPLFSNRWSKSYNKAISAITKSKVL